MPDTSSFTFQAERLVEFLTTPQGYDGKTTMTAIIEGNLRAMADTIARTLIESNPELPKVIEAEVARLVADLAIVTESTRKVVLRAVVEALVADARAQEDYDD